MSHIIIFVSLQLCFVVSYLLHFKEDLGKVLLPVLFVAPGFIHPLTHFFVSLKAWRAKESTTLTNTFESLFVLLTPLLFLPSFLHHLGVGLALAGDCLPYVFGKSLGVMHFLIAGGAVNHIAVVALKLCWVVASLALLHFPRVVVPDDFEELRVRRAESPCDALSTHAWTALLVLFPAGITNEDLAAPGKVGRWRLNPTKLAFVHFEYLALL